MPLSAFLIMPIQRLPRLLLLCDNLRKYTSEEHSDYGALSKAIEMLKKTITRMNEVQQDPLVARAVELEGIAGSHIHV